MANQSHSRSGQKSNVFFHEWQGRQRWAWSKIFSLGLDVAMFELHEFEEPSFGWFQYDDGVYGKAAKRDFFILLLLLLNMLRCKGRGIRAVSKATKTASVGRVPRSLRPARLVIQSLKDGQSVSGTGPQRGSHTTNIENVSHDRKQTSLISRSSNTSLLFTLSFLWKNGVRLSARVDQETGRNREW